MRIAKGQFEKGQEVVEGSGDTNQICCGFPEPLKWWDFLTAVPPPPGGSLRLALWDSRLSVLRPRLLRVLWGGIRKRNCQQDRPRR